MDNYVPKEMRDHVRSEEAKDGAAQRVMRGAARREHGRVIFRWIKNLAGMALVIAVLTWLADLSVRRVHAASPEGLLVTFVPTKEKAKSDPLLLPIDIFRPAKPDEKYARTVKDLTANGYIQAPDHDPNPEYYQGKCIIFRDSTHYTLGCVGIRKSDGQPHGLDPTLPLKDFREVLVLVRSCARVLNMMPARPEPGPDLLERKGKKSPPIIT